MTLEEYITAFDEAGDRASVAAEALDYSAAAEASTFEDRRDSYVETTESFQRVFNDFQADIETLDPPDQAQAIHDEIVNEFERYDTAFSAIIEDARATTTEEEFAAIDVSALQDDARLDQLCNDLQALADNNDIDVDLECGG